MTGKVYGTLRQAVVSTRHLNAVKILLAHGASINQPGKQRGRDQAVVDMTVEDEAGEHQGF
jgi:hypothetical protein